MLDLLIEGLGLMLIGMAIVFAFLLSLVGVLVLLSEAVKRWGPDEPLPEPLPVVAVSSAPAVDEARRIAAITAAVHSYRQRRRRP